MILHHKQPLVPYLEIYTYKTSKTRCLHHVELLVPHLEIYIYKTSKTRCPHHVELLVPHADIRGHAPGRLIVFMIFYLSVNLIATSTAT